MEEFVPYILILIGTHPDYPEKLEFERKGVFETQAACALHGDEAVEGRKMYELEFGGANYQYFCVASPNGDEREQVWRNAIERLERDRLKNEKLEANSK